MRTIPPDFARGPARPTPGMATFPRGHRRPSLTSERPHRAPRALRPPAPPLTPPPRARAVHHLHARRDPRERFPPRHLPTNVPRPAPRAPRAAPASSFARSGPSPTTTSGTRSRAAHAIAASTRFDATSRATHTANGAPTRARFAAIAASVGALHLDHARLHPRHPLHRAAATSRGTPFTIASTRCVATNRHDSARLATLSTMRARSGPGRRAMQPHVPAVRNHLERVVPPRRDWPRARHRPVRDHPREPPAGDLAPRPRHPRAPRPAHASGSRGDGAATPGHPNAAPSAAITTTSSPRA